MFGEALGDRFSFERAKIFLTVLDEHFGYGHAGDRLDFTVGVLERGVEPLCQ
jgi:hypothetical protein